jgi:5-methylcytosine-specific restriction endonuclease McrA
MPIRPELRCLYPPDWAEISKRIRFERAGGLCETCGRPHGFDGVFLTTAHLDHDPTNNAETNLRALCQRCHLAHDAPHHRVQRRLTYLMRRALGDLFTGPYRRR